MASIREGLSSLREQKLGTECEETQVMRVKKREAR
jgi:hypothetical protein